MSDQPILTAVQAEELFEMERGAEIPDWGFITIEEGEDGRWRRACSMILQHVSGHFWALEFEIGLTENCDSSYPWKSDWTNNISPDDPMPIRQVWPKSVTTTVWVTKEPS